jgi:hypothetical protein
LIFARDQGLTALSALSTEGTSMPVTVIAGPDQSREPRSPVPFSGTSSGTSASARNSSSVVPSPCHGSRSRPGTATSPCSSWSEASARRSTIVASGAAPPYCPLCLAPPIVSTSSVSIAIPRSPIVSVGTPGRTLPMSPITIASAWNRSGRSSGYALSALPTSSCPSIRILIPTGGRPSQARSAATWARMFDFVSAAPRPKIAPSRSTASNGGDSHSARSPAGTTS